MNSGIITVARLELTMRVRAGRWRWLLGIWFLILTGFTALLRQALSHAHGLAPHTRGTIVYGGLQLFTLALALLVVPALTAQSINGDREKGTLAVLQVTRLSAFDVAAGKLAAAWATTGAFVVVSAPLVGWTMVMGGVPFRRVFVVTIVVVLLLGVICAIGLGLSALLTRSTTSSVLSYLAVFGLTIGTLVVFALVSAVTAQTRTTHVAPPVFVGQPGPSYNGNCCASTVTVTRTDRTWWLLAPNPFVVLADAAPVAHVRPARTTCTTTTQGSFTSTSCSTPGQIIDPLGAIGRAVRGLRRPPAPLLFGADSGAPRPAGGLVWPYGLGADVGLGGFMLWVATRRLRTPRRKLPAGVRIA